MTTVLKIKNLNKSFVKTGSGLKKILFWFTSNNDIEKKIVLENINFELFEGETMGILGVNGAGKSTLLKIIAGTIEKTSGEILTNGRISALLELGIGMQSELTGRQNIYQSGRMLGYTSKFIDENIDDIISFAELNDNIDQPLKYYSSGMQARLSFSIATAIRPEILIVDEVLSVGDAHFQHKSFDRIRKFKDLGTTLLFVSHDMSAIKSICDRVMLIDSAVVREIGKPDYIADLYNALIAKLDSNTTLKVNNDRNAKKVTLGNQKATIKNVFLSKENNEKIETVCVNQKFNIKIFYDINDEIDSITCGIMIKDRYGNIMFGTNSNNLSEDIPYAVRANNLYEFKLVAKMGVGMYSVTVGLHRKNDHRDGCYEWKEQVAYFEVINNTLPTFIGACNLYE